MQEIVRKPKKKLPFRLRILMLVLALFCAGAFYLLSRPAPPKIPSAPAKFTVWKADKDDIGSVTLFPSASEHYTLLQNSTGYTLQDDAGAGINQSLADEIFNGLSTISVMAVVKEQVPISEATDFGINNFSVRFKVQANDGRSAAFAIGSLLPGDVLSWFLYDEDRHIVYMTDVNYHELCDVTKKEMHPVPGINFTPDLVTGVVVNGANPFGLQQKNGIWYMTAPFSYPADTEKATELTRLIGRMRLAVYEGEAEYLDLSTFGLDTPRADIRILFAPSVITRLDENKNMLSQTNVEAHEECFLIGKQISKLGFYCLYKGAVYKASNTSMGFWLKIAYDDYTLKTPVNFQPAILQELSIIQGDTNLQYSISLSEQVLPNNQIATDKDGNTLYTMQVALNGKEINTETFIRDYLELTKLRTSALSGNFSTANKAPFLTLKIRHENGERQVDFYDMDALYAAVSVDGVVLHLVEKQTLKSISLLSLR